MTKKTILPLQLLVAPDRNDPAPLILYHGRNCPDGFGAALAAWLYYGDSAQYLGLDHGEIQSVDDLPALQGRAVYILDFSFSTEILRAIEERAAKLVMLDHHKSAAEKLTGFACRCGVVHFDMSKSGARLAWEFFHPEQPVPALLQYIEDRDIWKWEFPESAGFLSALDMEPQEFSRWQEIAAFTPFEGTAGVRVAATSTPAGADLLVSGVSAQGVATVQKYDFTRADPRATTLQAVKLGDVAAGVAGTTPAVLAGD